MTLEVSNMNTILQDLKYGFRVLLSKRGTTAVALLALALGIGANTALFSVLYAVFWKPLPYKNPERLVIVWEAFRKDGTLVNTVNPANLADWKERNNVFEDIAGFITVTTNLMGDGQPEEVAIQYATPNLFSVLGVQPILGRNFISSDGVGERYVVMLSYGLWKRRYGADPRISGKQIFLNGRKATVAGVMPEKFGWFIKPSNTGKPPELWSAYPITPEVRVRQGRYLSTVARLKPGVTINQAQANMNLIGKRLENEYRDFNTGWSANVVPLRHQLSGDLRTPLWILAGAVVFVLLIACTNVANIMLSRSISRSREIALRSALGAGQNRLIRQLLTESMLLALIGGVIGTAIAIWGTQALALLGHRAGMDFDAVSLNLPVLLFAFGVSLFTGIFFGIVPSITATKWNLREQLNEGGRSGTGLHITKLRNALIAIQLSVALVLLAGAVLLLQSFWKLTSVNPGFDSREVLTFRILLPSIRYPEDANRVQFFRSVQERIGSLQGVKSAGMVNYLPFAGPAAGTSFLISGVPDPPPGQDRITKVFVVDNGFFQVLQIPLLQGRLFARAEMEEQKHVVLINQALARMYFPGQNPIGRKITINMKDVNVPTEIIGIVGNVKNERLDVPADPSVYWPHPELAYNFMTIVARTRGDAMQVAPSAVAAIHAISADQPVADIRTMESWLEDSTANAQFSTTLLAIFAFVALALAATGIFGVMSHAVSQRTREMGIRMALGARSSDVTTLVLKEGARILLIGSVIGCLIAAALTRFMKSMLYETNSIDPLTLSGVTVLLIAAGLIACWVPSRRAARVNPTEALRYE